MSFKISRCISVLGGIFAAVALLGFAPRAEAQSSGLDAPQPVGPFLNGVFPSVAPGLATGWSTENAFPNLTFIDPLWLTPIPGSTNLLLVGKNGQIWRFPNNPATTQAQVVKVLDRVSTTQVSEDQGFYSLVFHPQFGQSGSPNANYTYVCYNHKPALAGADDNHSYWRVSRFTWVPASGTLDPNSEFVLMSQYDRCRWHNGGAMYFDNSGFLNITCGDGGDSNEGGGLTGADGALSRTQKLNFGLFSGVFRIDVNNDPTKSHAIRRQPQSPANKPAGWPASYTQGYGIPNDNPWLDPAGSILEEYASLGLRSPHTAHYDALTDEVWIGDVGEGEREEMTRLPRGGNAQWGYREGFIAGPGTAAVPPIGIETPPALDYTHNVGFCIIGGMRYRGAKWDAALGGKLLYADHVVGKIWTATLPTSGAPVSQLVIDGFPTGNKVGLSNFCTDTAGEIYLLTVNGSGAGGTIRKLIVAGLSAEPPPLLSQTGVFSNLATLAAVPAAVPYKVVTALWSDAAAKMRWIILPNDGSHNTASEDIVFDEEGSWTFPAGTVLVKHFEIATNANDPSQIKRLETRFLVCTAGGGKYGVTYRWNSAGTDANLLTTGQSENFSVTLPNGSTESRRWDYPSRADCMQCHTAASGQALGVQTSPLNGNFHYESTGRTANQLATFNALGMFDRTLTTTELANFIESRAIGDTTAPVEHRVRSYLDMNCAHCHRPGGTVSFFDARLGTPLAAQGIVNGAIQGHFQFDPAGCYIKPGDTSLSALHFRMASVGNGAAMPPLAKNLVDQEAVALLQQYIQGLIPAEFDNTAKPQARYVRLTALSEVNAGAWTAVAEFSVLDGNGTPMPTSGLSVHSVDSQETVEELAPATNAIDGNINTFWHTEYNQGSIPPDPTLPHHLTLDLGSARAVGGFIYTPRQNYFNGRIANYQVHHSLDGVNWTLMNSGTWPNAATVQRYDVPGGGRKTRCEIAGPAGAVSGAFDVTVAFDMDVTDFTASDLQVSGGSVSQLRGKGYYYVATISPTAANITVSVPTNAANLAALGSRASAVLSLSYLDTLPPLPLFTGVPAQVSGPFQIGLTFGESVNGLTAADFSLVNATLDSIVPSGEAYLLNLTPLVFGQAVGIELRTAAVTDNAGNPMGAGTSLSLLYSSQILARNAAEASYSGGGMVLVTDPAAPSGKYLWLPDGNFPNNNGPPIATQHRAEFSFVVPHTGQWMLRGRVHAATNESDSFYVEVDGNQALGSVSLWDVAPPGTAYVWDYVNNRGGADPVILTLTAGTHTVTIYAREDGARLDRLELESVRPLATLATAKSVVNDGFTANLKFSESVTDLTAGDISITGGSVVSLTGSGTAYVVTVAPTSGTVVLSLPQNTVLDIDGVGNFASNSLAVTYRDSYQQWAFDHDVSGANESQLADEDGDGVAQLLEYAFNLDPAKADSALYHPTTQPSSGLPRMMVVPTDPAGQQLVLQYLRRKAVLGLSYTPQFSSTLDDFTPAVGSPVVETINADWERVTIGDSGSGSARFGRVVITLSPR
ncbi:MAG: hypothetical protein RLZZ398_1378 [Verrucomicrobiota bacterium]